MIDIKKIAAYSSVIDKQFISDIRDIIEKIDFLYHDIVLFTNDLSGSRPQHFCVLHDFYMKAFNGLILVTNIDDFISKMHILKDKDVVLYCNASDDISKIVSECSRITILHR